MAAPVGPSVQTSNTPYHMLPPIPPSCGKRLCRDRWETLVNHTCDDFTEMSARSIETARDVIIHVRKSIAAESAGIREFDVKLYYIHQLKHILQNIDILALDENEHNHVAIVLWARSCLQRIYSCHIGKYYCSVFGRTEDNVECPSRG